MTGRRSPTTSSCERRWPPVPRSPASGCSSCDGPTYAACVVGREPAGQAGVAEAARRFETVWTLDPQIVRSAARICASHVSPHLSDGGAALEARLSGSPSPASADLARATLVFQRLVGRTDGPDVMNLDQWRTPRETHVTSP